jgi:flavin-dependent dehydrogenase
MKIGIVGARVAGSYAGLLLARLGHDVTLFDHSTERAKPCGGGVTSKAVRGMHWLRESALPHAEIAMVRLISRDGYAGDLPLPHPVYVFSRFNLDAGLRQWAMASGAKFRPEQVVKVIHGTNIWAIETVSGFHEFDYLIGADGTRSIVRTTLLGRFSSNDLCLALGYNLPGLYDPGVLLINFQESGFQGYLWSFPCVSHSSVGIGRWLPAARASDLRQRVEAFIEMNYPEAGSDRTFYAALIPCLSQSSLVQQRVCGKDWALLGDAAGFADAITAEGIYYALRSAELLVEALQTGDSQGYERLWRNDFGINLRSAAAARDRFYGSMVLAQTFIKRALQTVRYSTTVQSLLDSLIAGDISYKSLFRNLVFRGPSIILQCFRKRAKSNRHSTSNV